MAAGAVLRRDLIRTFSLNSQEFHEVMRELRERDEGPAGELPREPRPRDAAAVIVEVGKSNGEAVPVSRRAHRIS
jgi:hypothetical protein